MNWRKPRTWFQESEDERYIICSFGKPPLFEAWRSKRHEQGQLCLQSRLPDRAAAQRVCEGDAQ